MNKSQRLSLILIISAIPICNPAFGAQPFSCKHREYADLQQVSSDELKLEYCLNKLDMNLGFQLIANNEKMISLSRSAGDEKGVDNGVATRDKYDEVLSNCEEEQLRIERLLEKRKVKPQYRKC